MTVECAIGLPNVGEYGDPRLLVALAGEAEAAGWAGVFLWDHVAYRERGWPVADPYVAVAAMAQATSSVRLGVLVSAVARRRPWKLARETASLDVLSAGRLVVGAGLGSQAREEFAAFGEDPDPRVRAERLDEGLAILSGLWCGEAYSHHGRHYTVEETVFLPRPVQRPRIPIWIAGRWPARPPFRRAARWDGLFATFDGIGHVDTPSPVQLRMAVEYTLAHREASDARFDVAVEGQSTGVDPDLLSPFEQAGLTWWIEKLGWFRGSVDAMRERIQQGPPAPPKTPSPSPT
jgi:alkanesulfonate monooxygenase SsuD/methylene tetrahydromethanopterin reductase-like flavin-dependent oxidoreductase (luciferase family)